jgi:hypothetical protein
MLQLLNSRYLTSFPVISAATAHEVPAITYEHRPRAYEFNQLLHDIFVMYTNLLESRMQHGYYLTESPHLRLRDPWNRNSG